MNNITILQQPRTLLEPLREASERWDRARDALSRRDYAEYDRLTGFVMPTQETQQ